MTLFSRLRDADDERRIALAQMTLWLGCIGPVIALGYVAMDIGLGHPDRRGELAFRPSALAIALAWVSLYGLAGALIGQRRVIGGVLGLGLFGYSLVSGIATRGGVSPGLIYPVVGVVLVVRAWRAMTRRDGLIGG